MLVCVLGAGNAGLFAANILKKTNPGLQIYVVGSQEIGIVGVGESSTEHFESYRKLMNLETKDIVKACYATFKYGVYFEGWRDEDYVHALLESTGEIKAQNTTGVSVGIPGHIVRNERKLDIVPSHYLEPNIKVCKNDYYPNQYHFDTFKLNEMLIEHGKSMGIKYFDDKITGYKWKEKGGNLQSVFSETTEYEADLFIDASGFQRLLIGQLEKEGRCDFVSKQDQMFVNSAIAFQCEHESDNYRCFTTAKKMNAGWLWRIPTYTRMGNGYAFNDRFITEEEAIAEIKDTLGFEPKIGRRFKFEAGYYDKTWVNNVVSIGLSSHFFEPLEATAIGMGITQARLLSEYLMSQTDVAKESYNRRIQDLFEQIFVFVRLHYVNCKQDTPFWQFVASQPLPVEVKKVVDIAKERMLYSYDVHADKEISIFHHENFNQVLYGLDLISSDVARKHLDLMRMYEHSQAKIDVSREQYARRLTSDNFIPHKQLIDSWINE